MWMNVANQVQLRLLRLGANNLSTLGDFSMYILQPLADAAHPQFRAPIRVTLGA